MQTVSSHGSIKREGFDDHERFGVIRRMVTLKFGETFRSICSLGIQIDHTTLRNRKIMAFASARYNFGLSLDDIPPNYPEYRPRMVPSYRHMHDNPALHSHRGSESATENFPKSVGRQDK